jgi:hypothetical protein
MHTDCKSSKGCGIIEERAFLETVRFHFAQGTDGCFTGVTRAEFVNHKLMVMVKLGIGEGRSGIIVRCMFADHRANVTMVGVLNLVVGIGWFVGALEFDFNGLSELAR